MYTAIEIEVLKYVLTSDKKGLVCNSKLRAKKDYPNLINQHIVYISTWGSGSGRSVTLHLTEKGINERDAIINSITI